MSFFIKHFSLTELSPVHKNPTIFIASQWQCNKSQPNIKYLIYRTCHAAYLMATWVLSLDGISYIFLTNWGYILLTVQSIICWIMLTSAIVDSRKSIGFSEGCLSKFHSVYWIIHSITNALGFLISIIYWTTIYGPSGKEFTATNFFVHGSNSIMILLDLCTIAHPVYLIHCFYPVIFGFVYLIFSITFYFYDKGRGGSGIVYSILDWNYPGKTTGIVIGILFFILFLHLLTFIIYKLKIMIYEKIKSINQFQGELHNPGPPGV